MMKFSPWSWFLVLVALAFSIALKLSPSMAGWQPAGKGQNMLGVMFGDARKLFANQFFTMADVYFHSGYYPSIFDKNSEEQKEIIAASHGHKESEEEEMKEDFLGKPKDWIDAFGRNFKITQHTHLEHQSEREILPWLRLSADLDPQKIETYTVGAFFLREHLNHPEQAEAFLREGLRNNPDSIEILFELGRIYQDNFHDPNRAKSVWLLGVRKYLELPAGEQKEDKLLFEELAVHLGRLEEKSGKFEDAINWLRAAQKISPAPQALQEQIEAIQRKISVKQP